MVNNCFIFYFLNTLFAFEGKLSFAKDRFEEREREYKNGKIVASG